MGHRGVAKMSRRLSLSTNRAAEIYHESLWLRRELCSDSQSFKMTDAWGEIYNQNPTWKTKILPVDQENDHELKANILVFDDHVTLRADEILFEKADRGCKIANFIFAHEIGGHLNLDHHKNSSKLKHFQLFSNGSQMCNLPPNLEEVEANFGGVFLQAGIALERTDLSALDIANRFYTDVLYVEKAQKMVRLDVFKRALHTRRNKYQRVIL